MKTDGGGWTVFQRRFNGNEDFYRTWKEYKSGFGNPNKEYWLGNENIHRISVQGNYELRINMEDFLGNRPYAEFSNFELSNENKKYRLKFESYIGYAGADYADFQQMNKSVFSTKDANNNPKSDNCAKKYKSGWWYDKDCSPPQNLNGKYGGEKKRHKYNNVLHQKITSVITNAMKSTTMMIRRMNK